jgi:transcriptional regulator with XRE-family HTH domain
MISFCTVSSCPWVCSWSQQKLADEAGVGIVTVRQLEAGTHQPRRSTVQVMRRCLEAAGVEFIEEDGGGAFGSPSGEADEAPRDIDLRHPEAVRWVEPLERDEIRFGQA